MLPQKDFEFISSQIASDIIWDKIVVKYLWQNNNNHTQFQDFWGGIVAGGNFPAPTSSVDPLSVIWSEVVVQFRNQAEWFESWRNDLEAGLQAAWMAWKLYKLAEQTDIGLNNMKACWTIYWLTHTNQAVSQARPN